MIRHPWGDEEEDGDPDRREPWQEGDVRPAKRSDHSPRPCSICRAEFVPYTGNQRRCHDCCRKAHEVTGTKPAAIVTRPCVTCGRAFTAPQYYKRCGLCRDAGVPAAWARTVDVLPWTPRLVQGMAAAIRADATALQRPERDGLIARTLALATAASRHGVDAEPLRSLAAHPRLGEVA